MGKHKMGEGSGRAQGLEPSFPQALPAAGIHIFASQLHTHLAGRKVVTVLSRDGRERQVVNADRHYSPHFQVQGSARVLSGCHQWGCQVQSYSVTLTCPLYLPPGDPHAEGGGCSFSSEWLQKMWWLLNSTRPSPDPTSLNPPLYHLVPTAASSPCPCTGTCCHPGPPGGQEDMLPMVPRSYLPPPRRCFRDIRSHLTWYKTGVWAIEPCWELN